MQQHSSDIMDRWVFKNESRCLCNIFVVASIAKSVPTQGRRNFCHATTHAHYAATTHEIENSLYHQRKTK